MTPQNPKILSALQKYFDDQQQGATRAQEESVAARLAAALEKLGSVTSFTGPQGPIGPKPIKGKDYFTEAEALMFLRAATPVKGRDYDDGRDGHDGVDGADGIDGQDGKDGIDGIANLQEVTEEVNEKVKKHEKNYDHKKIHDSKIVAGLEVDISQIAEGQVFQRKGNKIVGVDLPKLIQQHVPYFAGHGTSTLRSIPVTASRELDEQGIYIVDATAGNIAITVPSAAGRENYFYELIRIDATANTVTITPTGSETMSGMTDYVMQQWTDVKLFAYQSNYLLRGAS